MPPRAIATRLQTKVRVFDTTNGRVTPTPFHFICNAASFNIGDHKFVRDPGGKDLINTEGTPMCDNDGSTGSSCNSSSRLLSLHAPQVLVGNTNLTNNSPGGNINDKGNDRNRVYR